ncbi:hybrid sensor histidine kinase/response regulator transcription factor [Pseudotamlana carrageenivorans]|uniref:histidine kinase n=1 Tax=Pseudotamlana carrageenivorans TaxID=2069432 RepID=A0A2I7SK39_9FLAO|nr:two-component regulator propeller domain-containing protein [Tamlana carrageenivorans]AUS06269.1 hybrid sensor histidine kinase/response regulator [Tamlana carrageenivorans]
MQKMSFLVLFVLSWYVNGQNEIYKFSSVSTAHGLSQNSAMAITQDSLGQIWIGTRDGLNRYDGTNITVYRHSDALNSLSSSDIICLEVDREGLIWIGTALGLNKYNPKTDRFTRYLADTSHTSITNNRITSICDFSKDKLWFGTSSGISIYTRSTDTFTTILKGYVIYSVQKLSQKLLVVSTNKGLLKIHVEENNHINIQPIKNTEKYVIQDMMVADDSSVLLATKEHHIVEYHLDNDSISPYFQEKSLNGLNRNVRKLLLDRSGNLWIGTYKGLQIANKNKQITTLYTNINDSESINDNFIKSIFKDAKGSIWIGTYYGGVNIWDESNINFLKITQRPGNSGLSFKSISSIETFKNSIYFGTEGGGLTLLDTVSRSYKYINTENTTELPSDNIKALFKDNDSKLWIGTFNKGVAVYDLKSKQFNTTILPNEVIKLLDDVGVSSIAQRSDEIFIGTLGKGVIRYNLFDNTFEIIAVNMQNREKGLTHNIVRTIKLDSNDNLWVGTFQGLSKIDAQNRISNYFLEEKKEAKYTITCVFNDANNQIWAGTEVEGLFRLEGDTFKKVNLKIEDNEPVKGVRSIVEDKQGHFWISTPNQGILRFNPRENIIVANYTQKDGLPSNQFNYNASFKYFKNYIFFGGSEGVVCFNPDKLIKNSFSPQVVLTSFKIKNKVLHVGGEEGLLNKTISYTNQLELSHDQGNFNISFAIPNYLNATNNHYVYRLLGLEDEWIETSQSSASYTIQDPGTYVFQVKGINNDNVENTEPTSLQIKVNPAPWRTWWAFLFYGFVIFSILYYLLNLLKSRQKLGNQLVLEKLEAEQIKKNNKSKLEFFTNISHEFRTPLTLILGPISQILENYRGSSEMYKKLKVIESNSNHLLQLINRLMDFRKIESDFIKLETAEINIVKFLKEIYLSFSEYAKDGNYQYEFFTSSDQILVYVDRYKLERVFYNLISNAFRYTPKNGKIVIRIIQEKDTVIIQVEDSGVGIAEEFKDKIFERFFELNANRQLVNAYNKGTGIGLSIVKTIVNLHKGKIQVKDNLEEGKGSVFSVELKQGREHLSDADIIHDFKFSDDLEQYVNQLSDSEVILEDDVLDSLKEEDKLTVLLVEDNKPLRKFMRSLLKQNYKVLEAENGKVAYKIALREDVNLIVSDVIMPEMTGTELCAKIKTDVRTSHIPLILLTSRSSLIYKIEGLESGADDYISKPFNVKEFTLRVKNLLNSISRVKEKINANEDLMPEDLVLSSIDENLYKKALQIVEKNISNEQFDIPMFCKELGVSRTVLFKKIKVWTDFTPKDFIQHIRLKKAADLLEQDQYSISQISYMVGFKNPKYFSKCFRNKFDKTPTQYIKTFS